MPWSVRYALAAHEAGWVIPPWLLMAVQMTQNGHGCAACGSMGR
jgi:hypothetical protein